MIKKCFSVSLCILILFSIFSLNVSAKNLGLSASSAIVMVAQTGEVLYEHNAHQKRSMASTTKIMTTLLLLENTDLNEEIIVKKDELNVEGTSMGLLPEDKVTFGGLAYGMLLQSGNDAANVTANRISGSNEEFAELMNARAKEIGMNNTNFVTPSGLDDEKHYSTAYDMALLASVAIQNADFRNITSQKQATVSYGNPPYKRRLTNHNKLLRFYNGCIGIKTGFTKKSGRCLVSAAERDGIILVAVTLKAPDDWNDHKIMLDYGFGKVKKRNIEVSDNLCIDVVGGEISAVNVKNVYTPTVNVGSVEMKVTCECYIDKFLYAPVKKGDIVGKRVYYVDTKPVAEVLLEASETIERKKIEIKPNIWHRFLNFLKGIFKR